MPRPLLLTALLLALVGLALSGAAPAAAQGLPLPATEQVLVGPPDPAGPTTRELFLADPAGQIEQLVAVGHLVAWTVRTPANSPGFSPETTPKIFPTSTRLVVIDERGGAPLTVDFPGRWISAIHAFRGPGGPSDPRIAVRSCTTRKASSCTAEVLALTPGAPLAVRSRTTDRLSAAAAAGRVDSGQRLVIGKLASNGKRRKCLPQLSVRALAGGKDRPLPKVPIDPDDGRCWGMSAPTIHGRYAFATVDRYVGGVAASFLFGIDLEGGSKARWRKLRRTYATSEYTDSRELGPGITDAALYFEVSYTEELPIVSLARVDLASKLGPSQTPDPLTWAPPIASPTGIGCTVAATDSAVYRLGNPRCPESNERSSDIRRVVNPVFTAEPQS